MADGSDEDVCVCVPLGVVEEDEGLYCVGGVAMCICANSAMRCLASMAASFMKSVTAEKVGRRKITSLNNALPFSA